MMVVEVVEVEIVTTLIVLSLIGALDQEMKEEVVGVVVEEEMIVMEREVSFDSVTK
jgi:hypothetical protein